MAARSLLTICVAYLEVLFIVCRLNEGKKRGRGKRNRGREKVRQKWVKTAYDIKEKTLRLAQRKTNPV